MVTRIKVPTLSANAQEVTVTAWYKAEGDTVRKGDSLVEMTTDKAAFDIESSRAGILRSILATEKSVLPVGYVVALLGAEKDILPDVEAVNRKLMNAYRKQAGQASKKKARSSRRSGGGRVRATPAARRVARERGVDLAAVRKSDGSDVVSEADVRQFAEGQA